MDRDRALRKLRAGKVPNFGQGVHCESTLTLQCGGGDASHRLNVEVANESLLSFPHIDDDIAAAWDEYCQSDHLHPVEEIIFDRADVIEFLRLLAIYLHEDEQSRARRLAQRTAVSQRI